MFHIVIAGICLAAVTTPISAQLQQNPPGLGFQPTNDLTVAKLPGVGGWGSPPPPPPGGWPPPPPPPPPPTTAAPTTEGPATPAPCAGTPVAECPVFDPENPPATPTYIASTDCRCFYECSIGIGYVFQCSAPLIWDYIDNECDYSEVGVNKCYQTVTYIDIFVDFPPKNLALGNKTIPKKV